VNGAAREEASPPWRASIPDARKRKGGGPRRPHRPNHLDGHRLPSLYRGRILLSSNHLGQISRRGCGGREVPCPFDPAQRRVRPSPVTDSSAVTVRAQRSGAVRLRLDSTSRVPWPSAPLTPATGGRSLNLSSFAGAATGLDLCGSKAVRRAKVCQQVSPKTTEADLAGRAETVPHRGPTHPRPGRDGVNVDRAAPARPRLMEAIMVDRTAAAAAEIATLRQELAARRASRRWATRTTRVSSRSRRGSRVLQRSTICVNAYSRSAEGVIPSRAEPSTAS
jgi:hypothetical protein